jgi:hypothetical protein
MTETVKLKGMNVILFITDQERAIQHFPPDWAKQNLPGQTQLKQAKASCFELSGSRPF